MTTGRLRRRWLPLLVILGICCAPGSDALQTKNSSLPVTTRKLILHNVSFDDDHATIEPDSAPVLDEAVTMLQQIRHVTVVVAADPSIPIDPATAAEHTEAVRAYFIAHGVSATHIQTEAATRLCANFDIAVVSTQPPAWK